MFGHCLPVLLKLVNAALLLLAIVFPDVKFEVTVEETTAQLTTSRIDVEAWSVIGQTRKQQAEPVETNTTEKAVAIIRVSTNLSSIDVSCDSGIQPIKLQAGTYLINQPGVHVVTVVGAGMVAGEINTKVWTRRVEIPIDEPDEKPVETVTKVTKQQPAVRIIEQPGMPVVQRRSLVAQNCAGGT